MPVTIVNDPKLDLSRSSRSRRQAALAIVLEAISPADPWEIYY